ncbi:YqcC family protein [Halopseudomonas sp.]|uniref:YqcC family protein n=1 Tax=Halopseudomonas sp. TaxID=2901191 RepID=UPI00356701CE
MKKAGWEEMRLALIDLERELQALDLWSVQPPTSTQMASSQPFCVDTMAFAQWLQWIFIPRMHSLAGQRLPLPGNCQIKPMGEQSLLYLGRRQNDLLRALARVDRLATDLA